MNDQVNKPDPEQLPKTTPKVGDDQAKLLLVNQLTRAFKAYERATNITQKAASGLWTVYAQVGQLTKEEGDPILREFLKIARQDKDEFPSAVKTAEQYASRIRAGWKAGIQPNEGEGANAFYARAQGQDKAEEGEGEKATDTASPEAGERAKLLKAIKKELDGMTNAELLEISKWLAHKNSRKTEQEKAAVTPVAAAS